jgi:hypothetical protein
MVECVISKNRFYILDPDIISVIENLKVDRLRILYSIDKDGREVLIASYYPEQSDRFSLSVYKTKHFFIRTPSILLPFTGFKVQCYIEKMFPEQNELFRIKPVDFLLIKKRQRTVNKSFPYFTNNSLVIPVLYIKSNLDDHIMIHMVSFDRTNEDAIENGKLLCYITRSPTPLSFRLKSHSSGVSTGSMPRLINILKNFHTSLPRFTYEETINENGYPYGIMIFKEEVNA